jgi:dihydrolipoamide dehydrogenase
VHTRSVDVAIVGAGTAGLAALRAAREHTERVVLIEGGPHGTTCARVGCMPSKLLIAAAEAAHAVREAPGFGVHAGAPRVDGRAVLARVRSERDRFAGFVVESVEELPPGMRIDGHARFVGPQRLQVGDHTIVEAARIVLATGSRTFVPPMLAGLGPLLAISDDVFEWEDLPDSVAVFGNGVIGLELAQALQRLGVRTHVFGLEGAVGPLTDPAVLARARQVLAAELPLSIDEPADAVTARDGEVVVEFRDADGKPRSERFALALAATGRRPNLDDLGLEHSGLALDERGVPRFDPRTGQCGDAPVFLAGDANAVRPILHEAADEGRTAGDNAGRYPDLRCRPCKAPLTIVFTDPQIAIAGRSHRELTASGVGFATGEVDFANQGRSRVLRQNRGLLRVYGLHEGGELAGAELIAPRGEHLAHLLAWSVQQRLRVPELLAMPFYHPVIEEGLRTALRRLQRALHLGPEPEPNSLDCGPGA